MNKKLPGIYQNKIERVIGNNTEFSYASKEEVRSSKKEVVKNINIGEKINSIFTSPHYVYKMDVTIKTRDNVSTKRIIGRNKTHLITIDNELIPIDSILDIEF